MTGPTLYRSTELGVQRRTDATRKLQMIRFATLTRRLTPAHDFKNGWRPKVVAITLILLKSGRMDLNHRLLLARRKAARRTLSDWFSVG